MARERKPKQGRTAVIADDHAATADGVERWLVEGKWTVVGRVRHLRDILFTVETEDPGLLICDLRFAGEGNALSIISAAIMEGKIRCPVIIYTSYDDARQMQDAWDVGIAAWVFKGESREFVMDVVARVMKGERVFPETKAKPAEQWSKYQRHQRSTVDGVELTALQALMLLAAHAGESREEIASNLDVSLSYVNQELAKVPKQRGLAKQPELFAWITRHLEELHAVVMGR